MNLFEINFDGIVGPTHNYAGLSFGNLASMTHKQSVSNPRKAALQGLEKMKLLMDRGVKQAVLPPHERPHLPTLRRLGFSGSDAENLHNVSKTDRALLAAVSSSSAMWTANAATVSPSADSADGRVHFTPANLVSTFHRSIETGTTARVLRSIFANPGFFVHHDPLPCGSTFADEGAANHTRLCSHAPAGLEVFTYGGDLGNGALTRFPARQTLQASRAIARLHLLHPNSTFFVKQTPQAIDAGAFHNDVVCVGHKNVLLIHELAWEDQRHALHSIQETFQQHHGGRLHVIEVSEDELPLDVAIQTYLFNSQVIELPDGRMLLLAPVECRENNLARRVIDHRIGQGNPIEAVEYVDVRQSMHNGGGPACLRLRVTLNENQLAAMHQGVILTESLYVSLRAWIEKHYRVKLSSDDLADPELLAESRTALDHLSRLLGLGRIYEFQ